MIGLPCLGALPIVKMGTALDTGPDSSFYDGNDAPEGAYQVHTMAVAGNRTNIVELGETLGAGTYWLMLKVIEYDRYLTAPMHVRALAGGGMAMVYVNDRDTNRYWTTNYSFTASGSFSNITCIFTNSNPFLTWTPMFLGLYLGDNPQVARDPNRDDVISDYTWPSEEDSNVTYSGNLQRNGGFEAGLGSEWLFSGLGGTKVTSMQSMLTTDAYEGQFAFKASSEGRLYSQPFELQPNRQYTISLRMFGVAGSSSDTIALVSPSQTVPGGASNTVVIQGPFNTAVASWHYVSATGYAKAYPNERAVYQWHIHMRSNSIVDNIQIREGAVDATTFAERGELTLGHALASSLFTSAPEIPLVIHNSSGGSLADRVNWQVRNAVNGLISSGTIAQSFPSGNSTNLVNPGIAKWGWYRLVAWADRYDGSFFEKPFCYLPGTPSDTFGTHAQFQPWQMELLADAGVRWQRCMSAQQTLRWGVVEPSNDTFVFDDQAITNALAAGQNILGVLGEPSAKGPSWVGSTIDETWMGHFTNYVQTIVARYPAIKYWEVGNEPNANSVWGSDYSGYTNFWIHAWHAVTNANPEAQLVGFGGAQLAWVNSVIAIFPDWTNHLGSDKLVSTHLYSDPMEVVSGGDTGGRAAEWQTFADTYGVTVHNTEAGAWDQARWWAGSTGDPVWGYLNADTWIDPHMGTPISHQKNALLSLGYGISRYYIYDARQPVVADVFGVHTTILAPDDSISPKGAAVLALGSFLGPGRGDISPNTATIAMLFGGTDAVVAMWRTNNARYQVEFSQPVHVFDTYGNLVDTNNAVQLGRIPVFVGGLGEAGISNEVVSASFSSATDTVAPKVSIDHWTSRTFSNPNEQIRLLGIAVDEEDQPWKTSSEVPEDTMSYSWIIYGYDLDWREWSLDNFLVIDEWPPGATAVGFRARDSAGNIGTTTLSLGGASLRARTLNTGTLTR